MNGLELFKKLKEIDTGIASEKRHFSGLSDLKGRIETDILLAEVSVGIENLTEHKRNLGFVERCIDKYEKKILTPDDMKEINLLNRKYQRMNKLGE